MLRSPLFGWVVGVAALCAVAGCGSGSPKDAGDWNYAPPQGFEQQQKQSKSGATVFFGPTDDNFRSNLQVISGTNANDNAQKLAQDRLAKATSDSSVKVKEQEAYKVADSDGYTWLITKPQPTGIVASQRQFIVKKNNVFVQFTLTASEKAMSQYDQALADSLQGFKWGR